MANLTITIPDANLTRVRTAFGHEDVVTHEWVLATQAEVQSRVTAMVRSEVKNYERRLAREAADAGVSDAL